MNKLTKSDILSLLRGNENITEIIDEGSLDIDSLKLLINYKDLQFRIYTKYFCSERYLYIIKIKDNIEDDLGQCRLYSLEADWEADPDCLNSRIGAFYKFYKILEENPNKNPLKINLFDGLFEKNMIGTENTSMLGFYFGSCPRPIIYLSYSKCYLNTPDNIVCRIDITSRYSDTNGGSVKLDLDISFDYRSGTYKLASNFLEFLGNIDTFCSFTVPRFNFDDLENSRGVLISKLVPYLLQISLNIENLDIFEKYNKLIGGLQALI